MYFSRYQAMVYFVIQSQKISKSSVQMSTPQFNTSVPHKDHTLLVPKILQLNTKNPSIQHQNPLSSRP